MVKDRNISAIIQARIGSSRLPGKVLLPLSGKTVLEHVISRVRASRMVTSILVATSTASADKKIVDLCKRSGVAVFCGSEDDVLDRFYRAAETVKPEHIVRITADCPLMDTKIIDRVIAEHAAKGADYTTNTLPPTYPDGEDVEVMKIEALKKAWKEAALPSEREHVTPYIRKHPEYFKLENVAYATDLSAKRWTLDEEDDYRFLKAVFGSLYRRNSLFGMEEVLDLLKKNTELEEKRKVITRNEGYQKSLKKDKI